MLIFDSFKSMESARQFARHVQDAFGRSAQVFDSKAESDNVDPFPFNLHPPIVLVERNDAFEGEEPIEASVEQFSGVFAGT